MHTKSPAVDPSTLEPRSVAAYPDVDLAYGKGESGRPVFTRTDGSSY